ncbi:MAG: septum formation protein Maf [Roseivirga sp.]|nr:septum formation protein Maf [Roseivirga sp.]
MNLNYHLILASKSPRRQDLLRSLGLDFEIRTREVDESFPGDMEVKQVAQYLAEKKSAAFGELAGRELLITSDTTVVLGSVILNKPADEKEAIEMLNALSKEAHEVVTGVCLRSPDKTVTFSETTEVYFRDLTDAEIKHYVMQYRPMDKAGAYGIQEWIGMVGIEKIIGDYYNVMGLPTHRLYSNLIEHFT